MRCLDIENEKIERNRFDIETKTTAQAENDPIFLIGETIKQANNPASSTINLATAIVENVTKFREGTVEIIEIEINDETTTGTFVNGTTIEGASYEDSNTIIKLSVSQAVSTTTITNDGATVVAASSCHECASLPVRRRRPDTAAGRASLRRA